MKTTLPVLVKVLLLVAAAHGQSPALHRTVSRLTQHSERIITYCADDGIDLAIRLQGTTEIDLADAQLKATVPEEGNEPEFEFVQSEKKLLSFTLNGLSGLDVWTAIDSDRGQVALTYSDGGAIGNFHVRVFIIRNGAVTDASSSINRAVDDFKERHYCKPRGNNVQALKWIHGDLLLMTEVYPTGDCGPDLGHVEGYLVDTTDGKIKKHLTSNHLKTYPGVCLQNSIE